MRYRLRTLLILLAILPPIVAVSWWQYSAWKAEREVRAAIEELERELERQAEADQMIFHITEAPPPPLWLPQPGDGAQSKAGE